jgi:hypothetical protein
MLGAIQIIRDTLGGRGGGLQKCHPTILWVISLVKVDKMSHGGGGGLKSA